MNTLVSVCSWCGDAQVDLIAHGQVAPWIRGGAGASAETELVECENCGFLFFSHEFTAEEQTRMYGDYRGETYLRNRHRFEPWYTKRVNDAIGHAPEVLIARRVHLEGLMRSLIDEGLIEIPRRILDIGGDEGQFIPFLSSLEAAAVLEVSAAKPVSGVEQVGSWDAAQSFAPDTVMLCHVLEHVRDPGAMFDRALNLVGNGGLIYVEIPLDRPQKIAKIYRNHFQRKWSRLVARFRWTWILADLYSLVTRRYLGRLLPLGVVKQSEHVGYFTLEVLQAGCKRRGLSILRSSEYVPQGNHGGLRNLPTAPALGVLISAAR